uniref:Protein kinase domain-containing protein n=1 Tax=Takifugu rubripes TaxID=31033 RepID=A0A674PHL5_TAKRU
GAQQTRTNQDALILGEGAYAVVMKCHNFRLNKLEAVKMYKQHNNIMGVAIMEIDILERLRCLYSYRCNIIRWDGYFFTQSSICLSFELLDIDLGRYVSGRSRTRCLTVAEVRPILHQVTTALFHLKSLGIIHCDVKPENILCVDRRQQPLQVKLADFGLARVAYNFNPAIPAQTLCYRAPEVLVGRNYNEAIDMWSLGATAAGLVLGSPLYLVKNEYDALRAIIKTQGQLSDHSQKWTLQTREVHERQTGCQRVEPLQALLHGFFTEDTPSGPDPSTPLGKD